jgi:hypothetical protein
MKALRGREVANIAVAISALCQLLSRGERMHCAVLTSVREVAEGVGAGIPDAL